MWRRTVSNKECMYTTPIRQKLPSAITNQRVAYKGKITRVSEGDLQSGHFLSLNLILKLLVYLGDIGSLANVSSH